MGTERAHPGMDGVPYDRLVLVRASCTAPGREPGAASFRSAYDGRGGATALGRANSSTFRDAARGLRGTVHASLNGMAVAHEGGDWSRREFVTVAPLGRAVEENGPPAAFTASDAFWAVAPGGRLSMPGAVVVRPGGDAELEGRLFRVSGGDVAYLLVSPSSRAREIEALTGEIGLEAAFSAGDPDAAGRAASALRAYVVHREVIAGMFGAPVRQCGKWGWAGSDGRDAAALADFLGADPAAHAHTPECRAEDALVAGDPDAALMHAAEGRPETLAFVRDAAKSPGYARLAELLRAARISRDALRPGTVTRRVGGLRLDSVVRSSGPESLRLLADVLDATDLQADGLALAELRGRQERQLEESLDAGTSSDVATALAVPLAMMERRLAGLPACLGASPARVSAGAYGKVVASNRGFAAWSGNRLALSGSPGDALRRISATPEAVAAQGRDMTSR